MKQQKIKECLEKYTSAARKKQAKKLEKKKATETEK